MRNRMMIWSAVAALCLCATSAVDAAAVASEPAGLAVASGYGAASASPAIDATPVTVAAVRAERLAVDALPIDAGRMRALHAPTVAASRATTATLRAVYQPSATSLRPRPGWRWSI